jgi:hypothetical protein
MPIICTEAIWNLVRASEDPYSGLTVTAVVCGVDFLGSDGIFKTPNPAYSNPDEMVVVGQGSSLWVTSWIWFFTILPSHAALVTVIS